jgi:hypothetical protein
MSIATFEWPAIAGESAQERFHRLAKQSDEESALMSSVTEMCYRDGYAAILSKDHWHGLGCCPIDA